VRLLSFSPSARRYTLHASTTLAFVSAGARDLGPLRLSRLLTACLRRRPSLLTARLHGGPSLLNVLSRPHAGLLPELILRGQAVCLTIALLL
jgi:hypothetical protein